MIEILSYQCDQCGEMIEVDHWEDHKCKKIKLNRGEKK